MLNKASIDIKPLFNLFPLSKSRFMHGMQCPMWAYLEVRTNAPVPEIDAITQSRFDTGNAVGELARRRCDQKLEASGHNPGVLISEDPMAHEQSVVETAKAIEDGAKAIYEAAFSYSGVKVRVDILERLDDGSFVINEVKSSSSFDKNKHALDVAIQLYVLQGNDLKVSKVNLTHLNKEYIWLGGEYDLAQLFMETDLTEHAKNVQTEIADQVEEILAIVKADEMPVVEQYSCSKPFECPYVNVCPIEKVVVEHPISELPSCRIGQGVHKRLTEAGFASLLEVDEETARREMITSKKELNEKWFYTWKATVDGSLIISDDSQEWVESLAYPIYHLDFETINPALPIVINSSPFEQVPLQYSIHIEHEDGSIDHTEFLAEADDAQPQKTLLNQLLSDLGSEGTVLQYSSFETQVLKRLSGLYPDQADNIGLILTRLKDLGELISKHVFHKDFHGKWSIKKVYPVLVTDSTLSYKDLDGVKQGDEASLALIEHRDPATSLDRREEIARQLLKYCKLDTHAMVDVLRAVKTNLERINNGLL